MGRTAAGALVLVLALAAPAVAALSMCHPDPAGTRALQLRGQVVGYSVAGTKATIAVRTGSTCTTVTWNATGTTRTNGCTTPRTILASPRGVRVVRSTTGPDRLVVMGTARSWPLPVHVRAGTLQVAGDLAGYEALGGHGLWVTRLSDGKTTFVAPVKEGKPVLNADGAFYVDNVDKMAPANKPVAKFVPTSGLGSELSQVGMPVHMDAPIKAFSMNGTNIALVVGGGACDRVFFWFVSWRLVKQVSQNDGVTCAASGASRRISQIALGGNRAQWVTQQYGRPVLVAEDDIGCEEWVIGRPSTWHGLSLAADGTMLAFTLGGKLDAVGGDYRSFGLYPLAHGIDALAADGTLTAALANGSVTIHRAHAELRTFSTPAARSVAIRGGLVATTTAFGKLNVYRAGRLVHTWPLPRGTRPGVDLQYGIAVVTTRSGVYAIDTANGRTALLASTPAAARAQIEPIGVGYVYSLGNRGTAEVVPMSTVEAALGR